MVGMEQRPELEERWRRGEVKGEEMEEGEEGMTRTEEGLEIDGP
jgi:hypothetical protein